MTTDPDGEVLEEYARRLRQARRETLAPYWDDDHDNEWDKGDKTYRWPGGKKTRFFWGLTPSEYHVVDRFEDRTGCRLEGIGSGRLVFVTPSDGSVVKLPRWGVSAHMGDGKAQNRFEAQTWEENGVKPLLPVTDYSQEGWWVEMPLATKTSPRVPEEDAIVAEINREAEQIPGFKPDVKRANLGWYDGAWRLLDYGRPADE